MEKKALIMRQKERILKIWIWKEPLKNNCQTVKQ